MSLIVDVSDDGLRSPLSRARVKAIATVVLRAERVSNAFVSIALVSPRHIARLNKQHLGHAGPTDVISFSLSSPNGTARRAVVGDIYIAPAVARANATRFGGRIREELARLVVHGTLHVLGYDHPVGADRTTSTMWKRQERLLASASVRRAAAGNRTR